jgi:DNA-binding NarL/FixJ family response regulator
VASSSNMTLRLLIVEDDARYRAGIETLVEYTPGLALAGSFHSALAALSWLDEEARAVDAVLLDIELPHMSGIQAIGELKARLPRVAVIMLTVFEEPTTILRAICAGADGYLLKKTSAPELVAQIRAIAVGGAPLTSGVARTVLALVRKLGGIDGAGGAQPGRLDLTAREQDVLRGLVQGLSYKEVAAEMGVQLETVRTHIRALYKKLQVHSVAAAVARAIREGLV